MSDVLATILRKATESVEECQIVAQGLPSDRAIDDPPSRDQWRAGRFQATAPLGLFGQGSVFTVKHDSCDRLQQHAVFVGHLFAASNEHPTRAIGPDRFVAGYEQIGNSFLEILTIDRIVFVPDHQIGCESFEAPIGMGLDRLANQLELISVADPDQHYW